MLTVFALLSATLHVLFFVLESLLWGTNKVNKIFKQDPSTIIHTKLLAYNQGFYNLFLALGSYAGVYTLLFLDNPIMGRTLIGFTNASMLAAALVLISSNKSLWRGAVIQGIPSALALIALFLL